MRLVPTMKRRRGRARVVRRVERHVTEEGSGLSPPPQKLDRGIGEELDPVLAILPSVDERVLP